MVLKLVARASREVNQQDEQPAVPSDLNHAQVTDALVKLNDETPAADKFVEPLLIPSPCHVKIFHRR